MLYTYSSCEKFKSHVNPSCFHTYAFIFEYIEGFEQNFFPPAEWLLETEYGRFEVLKVVRTPMRSPSMSRALDADALIAVVFESRLPQRTNNDNGKSNDCPQFRDRLSGNWFPRQLMTWRKLPNCRSSWSRRRMRSHYRRDCKHPQFLGLAKNMCY